METKHTPGEWKLEERVTLLEVTIYSGDIRICEVKSFHFDTDPPLPEAEANAKLIAAAPDLLEAALQIKNEIDTEGLLQHSYDKLLAAIEKATK